MGSQGRSTYLNMKKLKKSHSELKPVLLKNISKALSIIVYCHHLFSDFIRTANSKLVTHVNIYELNILVNISNYM